MSTPSRSLTEAGPSPFGTIFVSYASEDREAVRELKVALEAAKVASVWMDQPEIDPGDRWKEKIREGLRRARVVLAVVTPRSVDPGREWIVYEQEQAIRLFRPLIPVLLEEAELPERLRDLQFADLRGEGDAGLRRLLGAIAGVALRAGRHLSDESPPLRHVFVGREREVREVAARVREGARDVDTARKSVAIQGMGGLGKSMLAAEVVRRLGPLYPGGVLYVQRGKGAEDVQLVLQRWMAKCDGRYPEREVTPVEVRDRLQRYGELLVLVDDVEERDFGTVRVLLDALPPDASRLLTTRSRKIQGALGSELYELERMSDGDALSLLRQRLDRLRRAPDEGLVRELVSRLNGHPLALELMAGRCDRSSDLPHLLQDLEAVLEFGDLGLEALEVEGEEEKDKYTSVLACLASSFEALERIDRRNDTDFARRVTAMGVFPGGSLIDEPMALAVWEIPPDRPPELRGARRALDVYVRRALLDLDDETELYVLHPLVRAYAHGELRRDPERFAAARERYVRHLIPRAREVYTLPPQEWGRYGRYERHIQYVGSEVVRGVTAALGSDFGLLARPGPPGEAPERVPPDAPVRRELRTAVDFAHAVRRYVLLRPELRERGGNWLRAGLAAARALGDELAAVRLLRELGRWHLRRHAREAESYLAEAVRLAGARGDDDAFRGQEGIALSYRGEALRILSRPREALESLERALEIHRRREDGYMEATTLKFLGETHWRSGRLEEALADHRRALEIFERDDALLAQRADMLNKIASVHFNAGEQERAIPLFERALELHRKVGNRSMEVEDLNDLGVSWSYLGRSDEAFGRLQEALRSAREIGYGRLEAIVLTNLAALHNRRGDFGASAEVAEAARERAVALGDRGVESWALNWVGLARQHEGGTTDAKASFEEGLALSRQAEDVRAEAALLVNLGRLRLRTRIAGEREGGLAHLEEAVRVMEGNRLRQAYGGRTLEEVRGMLKRARAEGLP